MNRRPLIFVYLGITAIVLAMFGYGVFWGEDPQKIPSVFEGKKAPLFEITTFDGKKIALSDFVGKPVILNFWASWCLPCRAEAPHLENTHRLYSPQGVSFIGIATTDTTADAMKFIEEYDLTFFMGMEATDENVHLDYGVAGIPETFFIDSAGVIQEKITGALTEEKITEFLRGQGL